MNQRLPPSYEVRWKEPDGKEHSIIRYGMENMLRSTMFAAAREATEIYVKMIHKPISSSVEAAQSPESLSGNNKVRCDTGGESQALGYAQRLATTMWEKHWKYKSPDWKPLPDLLGVLTQIDNMVAGMVRKDGEPCPVCGCDPCIGEPPCP